MHGIQLKLGKPYSRDDDAKGYMLEFGATFDNEDQALAFQQKLIQIIRETKNQTED